MKIGYSFWGFLGDIKFNKDLSVASTPDGNAFYSWSIIKALLCNKNEVVQIMPDRDAPGYSHYGDALFDSWCKKDRASAYKGTIKLNYDYVDWSKIGAADLYNFWDLQKLNECDVVLHEWRMMIPGRNDMETKSTNPDVFQPDLFIQECLFAYCENHGIPIIIFDLDYKVDLERIQKLPGSDNIHLFELGHKWKNFPNTNHVEIPFDFNHIHDFRIKDVYECTKSLVYIGNRYERDWCIDKYIPTEIKGVKIFGNWLESGRDSKDKWPNIEFCSRLQTESMYYEYSTSLCTILLAKKEYLENNFMTARIIESVFYGCVPLFIEEYGTEVIRKYAGRYADDLTVTSKQDVIDIIYYLKYNDNYRRNCIGYLRDRLDFMDARHLINKIYEVV